MVCVADDDARPPRVAFAIGRQHGSAVHRNRLRRRLRAAFTSAARSGRVPPGLYLVGARPGAGSAPFAELAAQLDRVLQRAATGRQATS